MTKRSWFTSLRSRLMLVVGAALVPALILFIERINEWLSDAVLPKNSIVAIYDRNGTVLVRLRYLPELIGRDLSKGDVPLTILGKGEGVDEYVSGNSDRRGLYAYTTLRSATGQPDLLLAVALDMTEVYAQIDGTLWHNIIGLGLIGLLAMAITWVLGDALIVKRAPIIETAQQMRAGDLSA